MTYMNLHRAIHAANKSKCSVRFEQHWNTGR